MRPCTGLLQLHELPGGHGFAHAAWSSGPAWTTPLRGIGLAPDRLAHQFQRSGGTAALIAALLRAIATPASGGATAHRCTRTLGRTRTLTSPLWGPRPLGGAGTRGGTWPLLLRRGSHGDSGSVLIATARWLSWPLLLRGGAHGHRRLAL